MKNFELSSDVLEIRSHYQEFGFAHFKNIDISLISKEFRKQFSELVAIKYKELGLGDSVNPQNVFNNELMVINKKFRKEFSYIWNASQSLPSLFGMINHEIIIKILNLIGIQNITTAWTPNLRIDCPSEDNFILPDHQDRHYNGGSENSCTVYFQVNGSSKEMGRLHVRPGSHKLGPLPYQQTKVRPYFFLEPGEWSHYPDIELDLEDNDIVVFHMDLVHASAHNRSHSPRITMQLRYSNLMDPQFKNSGWLPTYTAVTTKNNIGLHVSTERKS